MYYTCPTLFHLYHSETDCAASDFQSDHLSSEQKGDGMDRDVVGAEVEAGRDMTDKASCKGLDGTCMVPGMHDTLEGEAHNAKEVEEVEDNVDKDGGEVEGCMEEDGWAVKAEHIYPSHKPAYTGHIRAIPEVQPKP